MTYQIIIPESVYQELEEAMLYYESKADNLSLSFIDNLEVAMNQLKKSPLHYQKKHKQLRSIKINRFPYLIIFEIIQNRIYLYRLINARKHPKKIFKK